MKTVLYIFSAIVVLCPLSHSRHTCGAEDLPAPFFDVTFFVDSEGNDKVEAWLIRGPVVELFWPDPAPSLPEHASPAPMNARAGRPLRIAPEGCIATTAHPDDVIIIIGDAGYRFADPSSIDPNGSVSLLPYAQVIVTFEGGAAEEYLSRAGTPGFFVHSATPLETNRKKAVHFRRRIVSRVHAGAPLTLPRFPGGKIEIAPLNDHRDPRAFKFNVHQIHLTSGETSEVAVQVIVDLAGN